MDIDWDSIGDLVRIRLRLAGQFALAVLERLGWFILLFGMVTITVMVIVLDWFFGREL